PETYSADIVVSSCGAVNSAALMLRSANDRHPNGLANSSDQVGRNYMCHINSVMLALSRCENPTVFQKTFGLNDFYFASKEWDFPMGHIFFRRQVRRRHSRRRSPENCARIHARAHGEALLRLLDDIRRSARSK